MATVGTLNINFATNTAQLVNDMAKASRAVEQNTTVMSKAMSSLAANVSLAGKAFLTFETVKTMANLVTSSLKAASSIEEMSKQAGMGVKQFQELSFALQKFGIDQEKATDELVKFNSNTAKFVTENAGPAKEAYVALFGGGPAGQRAVAEGMKNVDVFFQTVLAKIGGLQNESLKILYLKDIFGRGGADLIGPADAGIDKIIQYREEAERLGIVMGPDMVKSAHDASNELNTMWDILKMKLVVAIDGNADAIAHMAEVGIEMIPTVLTLLDRMVEGMEATARWAGTLGNNLSNSMAGATNWIAAHSPGGGGITGGDDGMDHVPPGAIADMLKKLQSKGAATGGTGGKLGVGDTALAAEAVKLAEANQRVIDTLRSEVDVMGTSDKAMFVLTAQRRLNANATVEQREEITALASTLYDEKQHWEMVKEASTAAGNAFSTTFDIANMKGKKLGDTLRNLGSQLTNIAYKFLVGDPMSKGISSLLEGFIGSGGGYNPATSAPPIKPIPSYAVGTDYVPRDMIAQIHKGEAIIPASQNNGSSGATYIIDARGADAQGMVELRNLIAKLDGSVEPRALSAVADMHRRSNNYLRS